jgi:hypothetical protein
MSSDEAPGEVTWWLTFQAEGYDHSETVTFFVPPGITPDAYAAKELWHLAIGAKAVAPVPPWGAVYCTVYPDVGGRPGAVQIGQAMRMFRANDAVYQLSSTRPRSPRPETEA